jgi:hypothetical protein
MFARITTVLSSVALANVPSRLRGGTVADAVCIVLNPSFRDQLNQGEVRPLDYDYLKYLAPGPQRFDELLSFQIYGRIAGGRILYSKYCDCAPQVRYPDFERVKKQMYEIHAPSQGGRGISGIHPTTVKSTGRASGTIARPGPGGEWNGWNL